MKRNTRDYERDDVDTDMNIQDDYRKAEHSQSNKLDESPSDMSMTDSLDLEGEAL